MCHVGHHSWHRDGHYYARRHTVHQNHCIISCHVWHDAPHLWRVPGRKKMTSTRMYVYACDLHACVLEECRRVLHLRFVHMNQPRTHMGHHTAHSPLHSTSRTDNMRTSFVLAQYPFILVLSACVLRDLCQVASGVCVLSMQPLCEVCI